MDRPDAAAASQPNERPLTRGVLREIGERCERIRTLAQSQLAAEHVLPDAVHEMEAIAGAVVDAFAATHPDSLSSRTSSVSAASSPVAAKSSRSCQSCGTSETPEWRRGPNGPRSLCNACGLVYAKLLKQKKLPQAASLSSTSTAVSSARTSPQEPTISTILPSLPPMPQIDSAAATSHLSFHLEPLSFDSAMHPPASMKHSAPLSMPDSVVPQAAPDSTCDSSRQEPDDDPKKKTRLDFLLS